MKKTFAFIKIVIAADQNQIRRDNACKWLSLAMNIAYFQTSTV